MYKYTVPGDMMSENLSPIEIPGVLLGSVKPFSNRIKFDGDRQIISISGILSRAAKLGAI